MELPPIRVKIDVTKILKEHLFKGAKGTYLDVYLYPTPDDQYGNDYRVTQDLPREARDAGVKGPILGNAKAVQQKKAPSKSPPPAKRPPVYPDLDAPESDPIPF